MKQIITTIKTGLALGAFAFLPAQAFSQVTAYDIISGSPNHTTLTAAIDAAGLTATLDDPGSDFTVFAPDDQAFVDFENESGITVASLIANPTALSDVLLYHVLDAPTLSGALSNGLTPTPLNTANTIKVTVTDAMTPEVFVNQAQVNAANLTSSNGSVVHSIDAVIVTDQTVVDVALGSPAHSTLVTAVIQEFLLPALTNPFASYTVFAPTNAAFTNLQNELGVDPLTLGNLSDVLLYHVLDSEVPSSGVSNGLTPTPLNASNTLKLTVTTDATPQVFVNHANVSGFDLTADNGVVHVLDDVVLPSTTVADVALGSSAHTTLVDAVIQERLLPALTNPFATYTVFAPTNAAFTNLENELGVDPLTVVGLADILLYHVLDSEVPSSGVTNGLTPTPLNSANTLKLTVTTDATPQVFVNQANVSGFDLPADNGVVHVLDDVVLPSTTVADVAIGSADHTTLVDAVIQERLLPALTDPFASLTVFAPTNQAFSDLATALGSDPLQNPELTDILLYHVLGSEVLSSALTNGPVTTLNGQDIIVDLSMGVMINDATVTTPDLPSNNGVVHVIDAVLVPSLASIVDNEMIDVTLYPNPSNGIINIKGENITNVVVRDLTGKIVLDTNNTQNIDLNGLENGTYMITVVGTTGTVTKSLQLLSGK